MATRYWVGGSGIWNSSNTANWSATSGGAGGASVPTTADHVVFDANSGSGDVHTSGYMVSISLSVTGSAISLLTGNVTCSGGVTTSGTTDLSALNIRTSANINFNIGGAHALGYVIIGAGFRSTLLTQIFCSRMELESAAEISWSPAITQPFGSVLTCTGASPGYIHSSTAGTRAKLSGAGGTVTTTNLYAMDIEFVSPPTTWYQDVSCVDLGNNLNWNLPVVSKPLFFSMTP